MSNLFDLLKSIYTKKRFETSTITKQEIFGLIAWLKMDLKNLSILKKINKYILYLSPQSLITLLFFSIPKQFKAPFIKYIKKEPKEKSITLYNKIANYFGWTDRELELNKVYLERLDTKIWKVKFGIK